MTQPQRKSVLERLIAVLVTATMIAGALLVPSGGSRAAATQSQETMNYFTVDQLKTICVKDDDSAQTFCRGFIISVFEAGVIYGKKIGGGVCPSGAVDATKLQGLVLATIAANPRRNPKFPAFAYVLRIFQSQFPCQ